MELDLRMWLGSSEFLSLLRFIYFETNSIFLRPLHEKITKQEVEAVIESYKRMKWWP